MMTKAVWGIGISSLVSAGVMVVLCAIQWIEHTPILDGNDRLTIVEKFRQTGGNIQENIRENRSPLVEQAEAFALYLNPPKSKEIPTPRSNTKQINATVSPTKATAKFVLVATSYYQTKPGESMGLVLEPGTGYRWIKQGECVGHFVVEKVEPGLIIYRNDRQLFEMAVNTDITTTTPQAGRTAVASSQTDTTLFVASDSDRSNRTTRKIVSPPRSSESRPQKNVNRQVAVQPNQATPAHRGTSSDPSNSKRARTAISKTTSTSKAARPQAEQTAYDRRKSRA